MSEKTYSVIVPFHGEHFYLVKAKSAAEAKRKTDQRHADAEGIDWQTTRVFKARDARLETKP